LRFRCPAMARISPSIPFLIILSTCLVEAEPGKHYDYDIATENFLSI
jgi:hypothetical protein